jgi:hypothetical protein
MLTSLKAVLVKRSLRFEQKKGYHVPSSRTTTFFNKKSQVSIFPIRNNGIFMVVVHSMSDTIAGHCCTISFSIGNTMLPFIDVYLLKNVRECIQLTICTCYWTLLPYGALRQRSDHFISTVPSAEIEFNSDDRTYIFGVYVLVGKSARQLLVNIKDAPQPGDTRIRCAFLVKSDFSRAKPAATEAAIRRRRVCLENENSQFKHLREWNVLSMPQEYRKR